MASQVSIATFLSLWENGHLDKDWGILHVPEYRRYYAMKNKPNEQSKIVYAEVP